MVQVATRQRHLIALDDIPALARGCAILGGGGGGDPLLAELIATQSLRDHGSVRLVGLDDLPDDGLVMPCGLVGAPTIVLEKVPSGMEGSFLLREVESLTGRPVTAIMPFEVGGVNTLLPLAWASRLGLPLVDADGMGRAFPLMTQMTMNIAGISANPCVIADERGNTLVLKTDRVEWVERMVRAAVTALGGAGVAAVYLMTVGQAREAVVQRTISRALRLGELISADRRGIDAALDVLGGVRLLQGKIIDVERSATDGFVRGSAIVAGTDSQGRLLRLEIQNEFLVAIEDGEVRASVPSVIAVIDSHDQTVVTTERLRYGQRVDVIAFPCDSVWRSETGVGLAGPRAFGYEFDPVEPHQ